ncbi:MAG: acyltransferase [Candidatus Micrarchaeota archaeon]|nr:acyltransferase [Candidatus Micrarchaeota archaeon]
MRRVRSFRTEKNSLSYWWKIKNPLIVIFNFKLIYLARYMPSLAIKRFLYRLCGARIGKDVGVGLGAVFDIFFPENIEIGDNSIIGYNTVILGHEFLVHEYRLGKVEIGKNVMIGANCTILPGVKIGDNSTISSNSLVNSDVPANSFYGGVPARRLTRKN